jgi:hypothetical protein
MRRTLALSVATCALLSAPVLLNQSNLPFVPDTVAMAGKGGNGSGNSGGNGNSGGGNSGGGKSSSSEHDGGGSSHGSKAAAHSGNGQGGINARGKKAPSEETLATAKVTGAGKERNIHAQLAGLNSLKRNINGLMNSADPRMAGIREFVIASAEAEAALADLKAAEEALDDATSAYVALVDGLGLTVYDPVALQERLDAVEADLLLDPDNQALLDEQLALTTALQSAELAALYDATATFNAAQQAAATAGAAADEDSLRAALLMAANENRVSDSYLTDDIMTWAYGILGVGDQNGLIDDYIASN